MFAILTVAEPYTRGYLPAVVKSTNLGCELQKHYICSVNQKWASPPSSALFWGVRTKQKGVRGLHLGYQLASASTAAIRIPTKQPECLEKSGGQKLPLDADELAQFQHLFLFLLCRQKPPQECLRLQNIPGTVPHDTIPTSMCKQWNNFPFLPYVKVTDDGQTFRLVTSPLRVNYGQTLLLLIRSWAERSVSKYLLRSSWIMIAFTKHFCLGGLIC